MRNTMWLNVLLSVGLLLVVCAAASAQTPANPMGEWVLRLGPRTLFVLSVRAEDKAGQACTGLLDRPQHFQTADAVSYSNVTGPIEMEPIVACERKGASLSITVENPKDASDKDMFLLTARDSTHADMKFQGVPLGPFKLERATGTAVVSTDWEKGRIYSPQDDAPSNPEMKRIFDEDQRVRQPGFKIDWKVVGPSDAQRREETRKLLSEGALHSGEDFVWAAFVFQHGSKPEDYLLAHTLAIVALKKGEQEAAWIAAATLDRYLQSIKQPQIYGTQFLTPQGKPTTQEPYDRTLISDPLRKQMGVPDLEAQQAQGKKYDVERGIR